ARRLRRRLDASNRSLNGARTVAAHVRQKVEAGTVCKWQRVPRPAADETRGVIRQADHVQHERLAVVAHELRLPLSHIKGFVTSLRRTDVTWDEATRAEFLVEIDQETDRLAQLVDSLLAARAADGTYAPGTDLVFTNPASV